MNTTATVTDATDVTVELEQLTARRRKLADHLAQVEAGSRDAVGDLMAARQELGRLEADAIVGTVSPKDRSQVERALDKAQARRDEPWPERLEGARAALRDADRNVAEFAAANVDALIANAEQQVEPHVARVNALAVELDQAIVEASQAALLIGQMLTLAGIQARPNAVAPMRTDALRITLDEFTTAGGQPPVVLDRRYVPALVEADGLKDE
jgi:hypothetical protein